MQIIENVFYVMILIAIGVALLQVFKLILRIGVLPLGLLAGALSDIVEKVITQLNKYIVLFVNLLVLSVVAITFPTIRAN